MFSFHKFSGLSGLPFNKKKCYFPKKKGYFTLVGRPSQISESRCVSLLGSLALDIALDQRYTRLAFQPASYLLTGPLYSKREQERWVVCGDRPSSAGDSQLNNPLQNGYTANGLQTDTLVLLVSNDPISPRVTTSVETVGVALGEGLTVSSGMVGPPSVQNQGLSQILMEDQAVPFEKDKAASPPATFGEGRDNSTSIGNTPTKRMLQTSGVVSSNNNRQNDFLSFKQSAGTQRAARSSSSRKAQDTPGPLDFALGQSPKTKEKGEGGAFFSPFPAKQGGGSLSSPRGSGQPVDPLRKTGSFEPFEKREELAKQSSDSRSAMDKKTYSQRDRFRSFDGNTVNSNSDASAALKQGALSRVVSITYEEIGLFPRSFSRVLDRFLKQVFSDVENLVIQEYRFYRYLFLTTLKCLFIFIFVPVFVNFLAKTYIVRPLTEYFWNTKQTEIFLNYYQQKRAFAELKDFEEKIYFESLIYPKSAFSFHSQSKADKDSADPNGYSERERRPTFSPLRGEARESARREGEKVASASRREVAISFGTKQLSLCEETKQGTGRDELSSTEIKVNQSLGTSDKEGVLPPFAAGPLFEQEPVEKPEIRFSTGSHQLAGLPNDQKSRPIAGKGSVVSTRIDALADSLSPAQIQKYEAQSFTNESSPYILGSLPPALSSSREGAIAYSERGQRGETESLINSYTLKSSLFVYQTKEADKNIQQRYQEKTIELAQRYNDESIEAITNFFADLISLGSLFYLLYALEIQINITKSFLLEVFFGLDDSKKSLLILLVTDLLVGYHSSNLWELFFESLFHHYGLPESQTGIFLLVATLPVLLDVLFKYLIFRHLNRSSPATVATYHAMIE